MIQTQACPLCLEVGGNLIWHNDYLRVLDVQDASYPGFTRVVWSAHIAEMTDLGFRDRTRLMEVVFAVEAAMRKHLLPDKINIASLGNLVPHVHWHIIPRWRTDIHFPQPIWGVAQRDMQMLPSDIDVRLEDFHDSLVESLDDF